MINMMKVIPHNYVTRYGYHYFATDDGHIYSEHLKRNISEYTDKDGYKKVRLSNGDGSRKVFSVHRLILETFEPNPNSSILQVNHKDGNKANNSLSNLEWVTCKENINHGYKLGLYSNIGDNNNGDHKLCTAQVLEIINLLLEHKMTIQAIADKFQVSKFAIESIKYKRTWKHLTANIDFYKGSTTSRNDVGCKQMTAEMEGSSNEDEEIV